MSTNQNFESVGKLVKKPFVCVCVIWCMSAILINLLHFWRVLFSFCRMIRPDKMKAALVTFRRFYDLVVKITLEKKKHVWNFCQGYNDIPAYLHHSPPPPTRLVSRVHTEQQLPKTFFVFYSLRFCKFEINKHPISLTIRLCYFRMLLDIEVWRTSNLRAEFLRTKSVTKKQMNKCRAEI